MKKLTSMLLSLVIVWQVFAVPTFADNNETTEYWSTMESFGVVDPEQNRNSTFTVADMSKMIYNLLNIADDSVPEATHQIYTDVDRWHWAAGYIEWLYNNRVYTGDGSGVFEPDRPAMLSDVCTVALNLLGYTELMKNINDDTEAVQKAAQIKLLSSKVNKTEHEVTYDEFASICYELLFTEVIEQVCSGKKTSYERGGEFITEVLDINYNKGVILGANGYSLDSNYCDVNKVIIDGHRYDTLFGSDYTNYIGYRVKYYYDSEEDLLIAAIPFKNEEIIIKSENIISYQNNTYTFEENGRGKTKTEKCEDVLLLFNGKITTNRNAFTPKYGQVRLIDNDSDGRFECVISEDAVNIILEKIVDGIIYGKNNDVNGKKYAVDTTALETVKFVGNTVPVEELKENTVISMVISEDGKCGIFYVSEDKNTGILDSFNNEKIVVDSIEYTKADSMYNPNAITSSGSNVEIGIDVYGCIAYIVGTDKNEYLFGYLMRVAEDESGEKLILKILTGDGEILKLYTSDKLIIDGARMQTLDAAKNRLTVDEVIRYRIFNGEIRAIDTASRNSGFSDFTIGSNSDSLTMIAKGENMLYKSSPQIFKYYGTTMDVHAEFAVNDDTTVFFVPTAAEYRSDNDYYVGDKSLLQNDLIAEVQAYVTSSDTLFAEVVVVKYSTQVSLDTSFTIVDKILTAVNSDNEIVGQIRGLSNGNEIEALVPDQSLLADIDKGSIILYQANKAGEVKAISNIYSRNGNGLVNTSPTHSWTAGTGVNANVRVVVGYVKEISGTVARFAFKDNASDDELFNLKNCNIYVYDESSRLRLRNGTVDDLYDYAHYGSECDEVIICTRAVAVSDVFLIKNRK